MATAPEPDPYLVLGVPRTATRAEIRAAYRTAGAKYHPDRHQGNPLEELASAKMAQINRAYEILSDPARRAAFDGAGRAGFPATAPGWTGTTGFGPPGRSAKRWVQAISLLSLLPLALRFGGLIARGVTAAFRAIVEGLTLIRGTPIALVAALLVAALLVLALVRRQGQGRRQRRP
jgi:curved DNA-binding protein CbpA